MIESTTRIYFKRLEKGMPPWFLSVSFTYMFSTIGNRFIYGVIFSFVVHPKQYDIFSVTKLVTPIGNFLFGGVVGALFFLFALYFSMLICRIWYYVHSLIVTYIGFTLGLPFTTLFSVYQVKRIYSHIYMREIVFLVMYIHCCSLKIRIHPPF